MGRTVWLPLTGLAISSITALRLTSFVDCDLIARPLGGLRQPRKQELLISGAAGKGKIMLLGEIDRTANLNYQVCPGEGLIKLFAVQHTGPPS